MKTHIILAAMAIIGFVINETIVVIAQSNSTKPLTWLDTNITKTVSAPMISISNEDFWKNFEPLLEQSINGSTDSSE
jgi:hypothetical protein